MRNIITLLIVLIASTANAQIKLEVVDEYHSYIFKGSIDDKYPVTMNLKFHGDEIFGYYYYDKYKSNITMSGKVSGNKVEIIDTYEGEFVATLDNGTMTGTWSDKKTLPFTATLSEKLPSSFTYRNYKFEKVINYINRYDENDNTTLIVDIVRLSTDDKNEVAEKINDTLEHQYATMITEISTAYADAMKEIEEYKSGPFGLSFTSAYYVEYVDERLLEIQYGTEYYHGGASGARFLDHFVFDLQTGAVIKVTDFIKDINDKKLVAMLQTKLIEYSGDKDHYYNFEEIRLSDNFAISEGSITFWYDAYKMSPDITFTFDELKPFMKDNSLLSHLFK